MSEAKRIPEIPAVDPEDEKRIRGLIPEWQEELLSILPTIPNELEVEISNRSIISDLGVGGMAVSEKKIELDMDSSFKDKEVQLLSLKGVYFHERFHIAQGFHHAIDTKVPPVEHAIYEGAATRFENVVVGSQTPYGDYSEIEEIETWAKELRGLSHDEYMQNWMGYKFYDENTGRKWWFYRAGAYIIDQYLAKYPETTWAELANMKPDKIWELSEVGTT